MTDSTMTDSIKKCAALFESGGDSPEEALANARSLGRMVAKLGDGTFSIERIGVKRD